MFCDILTLPSHINIEVSFAKHPLIFEINYPHLGHDFESFYINSYVAILSGSHLCSSSLCSLQSLHIYFEHNPHLYYVLRKPKQLFNGHFLTNYYLYFDIP